MLLPPLLVTVTQAILVPIDTQSMETDA